MTDPAARPVLTELFAGQLILQAGCRDATHAIALAGRYGCRVLGVDLVAAWLPRAWPTVEAAIAAAGFQVALGPLWYRRVLAFASWRPQIVLGRLLPGPLCPGQAGRRRPRGARPAPATVPAR